MLPVGLLSQQCWPVLVPSPWPRGTTEAISTLMEGGGVGASRSSRHGVHAEEGKSFSFKIFFFLFFLLQPLMWSQTLPGSGTFLDCPSSSWHRWLVGLSPTVTLGTWDGRQGEHHLVTLSHYFILAWKFLSWTVKRRLQLQKPIARCLLSCPA